MSGDFPFAKTVSPVKCNEKPWDLWIGEIGHRSPRRDDNGATFTTPAAVDGKPVGRRTSPLAHKTRYRRAGLHRLRHETMSLHGLFPQLDPLEAAVCHMCGVVVKCSAAYRHLVESHSNADPILPPPPPAPAVKLKSTPSRSRHKKEPPPPLPVDIHPVKMETSPVHTAAAPISRIVMPQQDLQYLDEASTSAALTGEVQVSVESGELPVVSIQDTEELPLGENITDDIFAIMNSEGIQSADDITNAADWKNIIKDLGNMQEINFPSSMDPVQTTDLYASVDTSLSGYTIPDTDLSGLQFAPNTSPMLSSVIDTNVLNAQALKPATPSTKSSSRKNSKTKFNLREYDPNKHCGVVTAENPKPCTRSLTCKAHALSLRRTVEGRAKPFDTLLAEHRASRDAAQGSAHLPPAPAPAPAPSPSPASAPPPAPLAIPPLLVNTPIDLGAFNGLTAEQQVNDIYVSLLSVEDPDSVLPDTSSITSLLSQALPAEPFLLPDDAEPPPPPPPAHLSPARLPPPLERPEAPPLPLPPAAPASSAPPDVCWYASGPRPLALCTFNASHAGGAITLGKRFATVRSNIKSSLTRSCKPAGGAGYYAQGGLALPKAIQASGGKASKPEVRKLIVRCGAAGSAGGVQQTLSELFAGEARLNGHVAHSHAHAHAHSHAHPHAHPHSAHAHAHAHASHGKARLKPGKRPAPMLDLGFSLDPLLADEKC